MKTNPHIRPFVPSDYKACAKIYSDGIATGIATFETTVPSWSTWDDKFLKTCRYVAEIDGCILGWIALTPFSTREVYRGVVEVTLYIAEDARGRHIGTKLLKHLISESEKEGFWTLQAKIFPQNTASIALFTQCRFREVGIRENIAQRNGIWYDNVLLERRATSL